MPPRRNVEQKFRCANLETALETALAAGATPTDDLHQRDVYFQAPQGRLKLRTIDSHTGRRAELIAYHRPDGTGRRISEYYLVPVPDPLALEPALHATLGIRAIVTKRRHLLMSQNVRLHFDAVEVLGAFIEFEAVLEPGETEADGHARIAAWVERLGLTEAVPGSYVDLLEAHGRR